MKLLEASGATSYRHQSFDNGLVERIRGGDEAAFTELDHIIRGRVPGTVCIKVVAI